MSALRNNKSMVASRMEKMDMKRVAFILILIPVCLFMSCRSNEQASTTHGVLDEATIQRVNQTGKRSELSRLEAAVHLQDKGTIEYQQALNRWWNVLMLENDQEPDGLTKSEMQNISVLAYLVAQTDRFYFAQDLTKNDILTLLAIYYYSDGYFPMYARSDWGQQDSRYVYGADSIDDGQSLVSASSGNMFTEQMLGISIPNSDEDYLHPFGDVLCKDGVYYIEQTDYWGRERFVSGYKDLGEGLFYVILNADDSALPDSDADKIGSVSQDTHLVIVRSDSAFGFTVIAKLSQDNQSILKEDWQLPNNMVWVADMSQEGVN
jgi:hypothetical protein